LCLWYLENLYKKNRQLSLTVFERYNSGFFRTGGPCHIPACAA
jgi:hypothetical protein